MSSSLILRKLHAAVGEVKPVGGRHIPEPLSRHFQRGEVNWKTLVHRVPVLDEPYGFEMSCQFTQFRGKGGKSRVGFSAGIRASQLRHSRPQKGLAEVDLLRSILLRDPLGHDATSRDSTVSHGSITRLPLVRYGKENWVVLAEIFYAPPGSWEIAYEFQDNRAATVSAIRRKLVLRDFSTPALQISDILIARRIKPRAEHPKSRDDYVLLSNPRRAWFGKDLPLYFEVYNLAPDTSGSRRLKVTIQRKTRDDWKDIQGWNYHSTDSTIVVSTTLPYNLASSEALQILAKDEVTGETVSAPIGIISPNEVD